jgi:hypothetical protein
MEEYRVVSESGLLIPVEDQPIDTIKDAVIRMNKMDIYVFQFMKAYYLYCLHNNLDLPDLLDENFIRLCFRAVSTIQEKRGTGLSNQEQKEQMARLLQFYKHEFSSVVVEPLPLRDSLTQCIVYSCTTMSMNIRNNITMHFVDRVKKTVFQHCFVQYRAQYSDEQWKAFSRSERKHFRVLAQQHAKLIQKDILNYTSLAPEMYRDWIEAIGRNFVPTRIIPSRYPEKEAYKDKIAYDVKVRPLDYLKRMVFMDQYLEWLGVKQFNAFPLQKSVVPKHVEFDTTALEALLLGTTQANLIRPSEINESDSFKGKRMKDRRYKVWSRFFNLHHKMFKSGPLDPITRTPSYVFDYGIKTDGISISVRFVRIVKSSIASDNKKSKVKRKPKSEKLRGKEPEGKAEKAEVEEPNGPNGPNGPKEKKLEFPYFEDLSEEQIQTLQHSHRIYIDPGKENIIYCMDDEPRVGTRRDQPVPKANVFKYTRKQRLKETGRMEAQETIRRYKKDHQLGPIEAHVSTQNSKTCNYDSFMTYLLVKNEANRKLFEHYEKEFFRKLKLRTYINKQRSESRLVNNLKRKFCTDNRPLVLVYGDWSIGRKKQMKNMISTPMIGLQRRLHKAFGIVQIDEYRTSCIDNFTSRPNVNAKVFTDAGKRRSLHRVLVSNIPLSTPCTDVETRKRFQHRDLNAVRNFKKITDSFLRDRTRPWALRRTTKKNQLYSVSGLFHRVEPEVTAIDGISSGSKTLILTYLKAQ